MQTGGPAVPPEVGSRTPSRQVFAIAAAVIAALVVGTIAAVLLLSSRQPGVGATTPSPSPSAEASLAASESSLPSPSSTANPSGSPDEATRPVFGNEALATVRVNDLNVRAGPSTSARILDNAGVPVQLQAGDHLLVISDATWADGRWWLEIGTDQVRADQPLYDPLAIIGFVAAGTRADPWLQEDNAWCPGDPSLTTLLDLSAVERLGCYNASPITFSAYRWTKPADAGLGGMCEPPNYPIWLVCDNVNYSWVNRDGGAGWEFLLHFDPARGIPPTDYVDEGSPNPQLTITGHFDDPAAELCDPMAPTTSESVLTFAGLTCRTRFVVEQIN